MIEIRLILMVVYLIAIYYIQRNSVEIEKHNDAKYSKGVLAFSALLELITHVIVIIIILNFE